MQGGAVWLARQAHNLKVVGSNPSPAPNFSALSNAVLQFGSVFFTINTMSVKQKLRTWFRNKTLRYQLFGVLTIALGLILLGVVSKAWWEVNYARTRNFCIYLEDGSSSLRSGADVRLDGFKVGQVESISLQQTVLPSGESYDYVRVKLAIDAKLAGKRFAFPRDKMFQEDLEKYVQEQVVLGLRARVVLPALTAPGMIVEFVYKPEAEPIWSRGKNEKDPIEIPTMRNRDLQDTLSEVANYLANGKTEMIVEKINSYSATIAGTLAMFDSINFEQLCKRIDKNIAQLQTLDIAGTRAKIKQINEILQTINDQVRAGTPVDDALFAKLNNYLQQAQEKNNALIKTCEILQTTIRNLNLPEKLDELEKQTQILKSREL